MMICEGIPEELITEILLRLPSKYLVRFSVVCKSWNSLITSSTFIRAHLDRSPSRVPLLLLKAEVERPTLPKRGQDFSLHWDIHPFQAHKNHKLMNYPMADQRLEIVGTCNGLVCLTTLLFSVFIWNPCIRKHMILPEHVAHEDHNFHEISMCRYGFGYDSGANDYKVVRVVSYYTKGGGRASSCAVWSLRKPSWNNLSADLFPVTHFWLSHHSVVANGAVHWVLEKVEDNCYSIVSFDMSNEQFGEIMIPEVVSTSSKDVRLSRYMNSLALFYSDSGEYDINNNCELDMWIMKEYGVEESWSKLLTVQFPDVSRICFHGFRNNGEVMITMDDNGDKKWVNPRSTNIINEFRIDGSKYKRCNFVEPFVESLVLLDQPSAISTEERRHADDDDDEYGNPLRRFGLNRIV